LVPKDHQYSTVKWPIMNNGRVMTSREWLYRQSPLSTKTAGERLCSNWDHQLRMVYVELNGHVID